MALDKGVFEYLKPTDAQVDDMADLRHAAKAFYDIIETRVPDGADKTYAVRKLREVAMWLNIAVTRDETGAPRV